MRSRILIILCLAVAIVYQSCDSSLNIDRPKTFLKYLGRDGNQTSVDMVEDAQGDVYIVGTSLVSGEKQRLYILKVSSGGITKWEKLYGDKDLEDLYAKDIEILSDGTLAVVSDRVVGSEKDFTIHILSPETGDVIKSSVGGKAGVDENAMSITQIDGGFIVALAMQERDYKISYLYKTDENLSETTDLSWTPDTRQTNGNNTIGYDFIPLKVFEITPVGSDEKVYYSFGYTRTPGSDVITDFNYFAMVTNSLNAGPKLILIPGENPNSNEHLSSVVRVPDANGGGYALIGYTDASGTQNLRIARLLPDLYLPQVKIEDPKSALYGNRFIQTVSANLSTALPNSAGMLYTSDREALVLGQQRSGTATSSIYLDKVQQSQSADTSVPPYSSLWSSPKIFGGAGDDSPAAVLQTVDGHILVCGTMVIGDALGQTKIVLMRLSSDGMLGD